MTYANFGAAFPIQDEDAIDIVHREMVKKEYDIVHDPLNYTAIATMPTECFKLQKKYFVAFVKDRAF